MCMTFQNEFSDMTEFPRPLLTLLMNKWFKLVWKVFFFLCIENFTWCNHTWSTKTYQETPNMSRSQHIIVAVKQEHHPQCHLKPASSSWDWTLFSLSFFLAHSCLFSRIPHFAAPRADGKFATFLSSGSTSALFTYAVSYSDTSLRCL